MITTSFGWVPLSGETVLSTNTRNLLVELESNAAGTGYFVTWNDLSPIQLKGRLVGSDGTPVASEFAFNPSASLPEGGAKVAGLSDGRFVAAYYEVVQDPSAQSADIHARIFSADGSPAESFGVSVGSFLEHTPDVTALADGGFAVSWSRALGSFTQNTYISVYNADGTVRHAPAAAHVDPGKSEKSAIAALAGGGFVVAWHQQAPGVSDTEVRFRRFDAAGNPLDADNSGVLIDDVGSRNEDIQIAGLPDGGFVVAYEDNEWGTGRDITTRVYNADGTARSGFIQANSLANGATTFDDQNRPSLAVAPEGYFVVGWGSDDIQWIQAFTSTTGDPVGTSLAVAGGVFEDEGGEITTLNGGVLASAWATRPSPGDDGDVNAVHTTTLALRRFKTGDDSDQTIHGVNSTIGDVIFGLGGKDIIDASTGDDTIDGGEGNDTIIGGLGDDTAVFSQSAVNYLVQDFGSVIRVRGPDGVDTVSGVEHLKFADRIIAVTDDGNALFDTLYYLSRNPDVFLAGINALDHFNASGWHEGRNPNAYFDVTGYLGVNKDVAAAGVNPLDHYHQNGWHEGRDPSAFFDTTLYLIRNPDVAAAGIDPLAHYLQYGAAEGRKAYAAIGGNIVGGFDAEYYLFRNPDVAAAGVDPLTHFDTFGWHEGRNPNGYFDTVGYLAQYSDVAAAGMNPLDHYMQYGWQEGRDPSAGFDTQGYLAANADVAAAHVNPLEHYLQYGIYEGRAVVNDGMWG